MRSQSVGGRVSVRRMERNAIEPPFEEVGYNEQLVREQRFVKRARFVSPEEQARPNDATSFLINPDNLPSVNGPTRKIIGAIVYGCSAERKRRIISSCRIDRRDPRVENSRRAGTNK